MTIWQVDNRIASQSPEIITNRLGSVEVLKRSQHLSQLVSYIDGTFFANLPVENYLVSRGVLSFHSSLPVNPALSLYFDWWEPPQGVSLTSFGDFQKYIEDAESSICVSTFGNILKSSFMGLNSSNICIESFAEMYTEVVKRNWVKWSDIGNLNFDLSLSNIAGERPMFWSGLVYKILKLDKQVVVYGENGVSLLYPHDVSYGLSEILPRGLKGRDAVVGTDLIHFFIDNLSQLYSFSGKLECLDYSEYLSALSNPVLSFDSANELLYICDGSIGFVYSPEMHSLGSGPPNITGIDYQNTQLYIAAPGDITIPTFEIWTDILDFGTRHGKTLHMLEVGTDHSGELLISVEFRIDKSQAFIRLPWVRTDPAGVAQFICHGKEFRIGIKVETYQYLEIDYINIEGRIT